MSPYTVVTEHIGGKVTEKVFPTWEEARDYATEFNPDADGSMMPNISDSTVARYEAQGHERQAYGYWLRTNRHAAIFSALED